VSATDHGRWQADIAAYALDALEPDEARAVEAHLADCERCRAELRWLEPAVEVLAESVPQVTPPPRLRDELLRVTHAEAPEAARGDSKREWRAWALRPATALAATAVAAAGVAGYALRGDEDAGPADAPVAVVGTGAAEDAVAVLERDGDSGTLRVSDVPVTEGNDVYQVWIQHGASVEASSAFRPEADGSADTTIPAGLEGADKLMVTLEPEPDRPVPSSKPLFETTLE
jgi:anti-sigma-K factor RskA